MLKIEALKLCQGEFSLAADFSIEEGRRVAVLGPSGGGKSTLLAGLSGFLAPEEGCIFWRGRNITSAAPAARPISMIFQDNNLFPHLSAAQNVGLGISPGLRLDAQAHGKVAAALERVGLVDKASHKPATLSGGQIARVALARLLVQGNPLVLLDEPFAALGPGLRAEMLDLVSELVAETGATLLMVSHAPEDARRIADEVVLVAEAVAHAPRKCAELFAAPPPAMAAWLGM